MPNNDYVLKDYLSDFFTVGNSSPLGSDSLSVDKSEWGRTDFLITQWPSFFCTYRYIPVSSHQSLIPVVSLGKHTHGAWGNDSAVNQIIYLLFTLFSLMNQLPSSRLKSAFLDQCHDLVTELLLYGYPFVANYECGCSR